ncbi:MAG: DUF368 domain-containing protein [Deltaproteobacteria bacterium]|nr:DUF368 domain-containing protein [Deltaproteobacteria bacterium]
MSQTKQAKGNLGLALYGFSMGTANVIPGVSGGTMALIHGIYEDLVDAINSANWEFIKALVTLKWKKAFFILHWRFLVPLGIGVTLAVVSLAKLIPYLIEHYRTPVSAFFVGLIAASSVVIARQIPKWTVGTTLWGLLSAVVAFWVVGLIPVQTPTGLWFIFLCGVLSIMAMLLPGISGAFILLVLGKYAYILGNVRDLAYHARLSAVIPLTVFAIGCILGLAGLARILGAALKRYRGQTMAALGGLMIGSLRTLWPWREVVATAKIGGKTVPTEEANRLPGAFNGEVLLVIGLVVVGIFLVLLLERLASGGEGAEAGSGSLSKTSKQHE